MDSNQISGIIRAVLAAIGGFVLAKGWVSAEIWAWLTGGALTIGPAIWSWFINRPSTIAAAAQKIDGVNVQVAPSAPDAVKTAVADAKAAGH